MLLDVLIKPRPDCCREHVVRGEMQTSESVDVSLNPVLHLFESLFSHLENGANSYMSSSYLAW